MQMTNIYSKFFIDEQGKDEQPKRITWAKVMNEQFREEANQNRNWSPKNYLAIKLAKIKIIKLDGNVVNNIMTILKWCIWRPVRNRLIRVVIS